MKTLKAAILVGVMAPLLALAAPRSSLEAVASTAKGAATGPVALDPAPEAPAAGPGADAAKASSAPAATGTPTPVATTTVALSPDEKKAEALGLSVAIDLDHWLGTGTFYNPSYYAYLAANLSIVPRYAFSVKGVTLAVSLAGRLTYEYTLPDGTPYSNGAGRRFAPWDTRLGLSAPGLFKNEFTGISISPSVGFVIPTTLESWHATLVTSVSLGLSVAKTAGKFDFLLTGSGSRSFHLSEMNATRALSAQQRACNTGLTPATTAAAGVDCAQPGQMAVLTRGSDGAFSDSIGNNTAYLAILGGSITFRATEELSFNIGYTYLRYWRYAVTNDPNDPNTPKALTTSGGSVATTGMGNFDRTFGVLAAAYQLTEHYGVSLSASTIQTPRSPGAGGAAGYFRFPFWAVDNGPSNVTSVNFTFSAAY